jgi:hypothetical protein
LFTDACIKEANLAPSLPIIFLLTLIAAALLDKE